MTSWHWRDALVLAALAITAVAPAAHGDEVHVFAAGAAQSVIEAAREPFARASGHQLRAEVDTVGALRDRVLAGARPDIVILSRVAMDRLAEARALSSSQRLRVGEIRFGFALPANAPVPDVSTPEALRAFLQSMPSIAYGSPERGATAGTHFQRILTELGLLDELGPRLIVVSFGADAVTAVAQGRAALGVSQASEIVPVAGVQLVTALPARFRLSTPYEAAALAGEPSPAARAFLQYLAGPEGVALFRRAGFVE